MNVCTDQFVFPWDFQPTVQQGTFSAQANASFTSEATTARLDCDISNVSFTDAGRPLFQLAGFPIRIAVGKKGLANGQVEWKLRAGGGVELVPLAEAARRVADKVRSAAT